MKYLMKPVQWIYCIYALLLFIVIMILIFPFVIIASLFGRIRGGNMIYRLCMLWSDIWFPLVLIFPKRIYLAPHDPSKPYLFVTNHISYLDACIVVKAYRMPLRALGKIEMSRIPIFGFIYKYAVVTVDRTSSGNRAKSVRILESVIKKGISILVFPEGTFNLTGKPLKEFYDGAFRVAIETQTPMKPVIFLDSYSRMNYKSIFSLTPGVCRCLYLDEISVKGYSMNDVSILKQKVYHLMEKTLKDFNAAWISHSHGKI